MVEQELHMTVAAAPHASPGTISIEHELRMLKAALLYADKVRLCSPAVNIVAAVMNISTLPTDDLLQIYGEAVGDPTISDFLALKRGLFKKKHRNRQELLAVKQIERLYSEASTRSREYFEELAENTHIEEIARLVDLGLVELQTLDWNGNSDVVQQYFDEVADAVLSSTTYPILDDTTGNLVRQAIKEQKIEVPTSARGRKAKHAGIVANLFESLPLFDNASVDEILDIRREFDRYLARFRAAVIGYSAKVHDLPWDDDFEMEVKELYLQTIGPTLQEIEEAVKANRIAKHLVPNLFTREVLEPSAIGLAISLLSDFPALLAVAAGTAAVTLTTVQEWREKKMEVEANQLYFFYRTSKRLGH